jgi:ABC-type branched-subunit amino acid transport system substrate-binding protein
MKHHLASIALVTVTFLTAGCGGRPASAPILVGHVATVSGPGKEQGEQATRGIRLAVKEANQAEARPFAALHTDARGKMEAYEAEAVRLAVVNHVAALVGGITAEEVERLDQARTVVIGLTGSQTRAMSDLVFLTGLAPAARGRALAQLHLKGSAPAVAAAVGQGLTGDPLGITTGLAVDTIGRPVIVLADERREENLQVAEAFGREWPAGARAGPTLRRFGKDPDLAVLARQIGEQLAPAVMVAGDVDLVSRLRALLPTVRIYFGGEDHQEVLQRQPDTPSGVYLVTAFVADADTPRARAFARAYQDVFKEAPGPAAALAYESAQLLFQAMRQIDNPSDRTALATALRSCKDFPGLCGTLAFEGNVLRRPVFVVRLNNGRPVTVGRFEP